MLEIGEEKMNGYQKYKQKSIYSMSGPELLHLLYEEAKTRLNKAGLALEEEEYAMFDDCLKRTTNIVRYLIEILDNSQPISRDLRRIYNYLILDISKVRAGREREKEELGKMVHILGELQEAFDEAARKTGSVHGGENRGVLG